MTIVENAGWAMAGWPARNRTIVLSPGLSRPLLVAIVIAAVGFSLLPAGGAPSSTAVLNAGDDLTRLMRFMAAIKAVLVAGAVVAVLWRLGSPVSVRRFYAYGAACALMAAGPGVIWGMAHVGRGALLLHGGLALAIVIMWRDPAVPARLEGALTRRSAAGARRHRG